MNAFLTTFSNVDLSDRGFAPSFASLLLIVVAVKSFLPLMIAWLTARRLHKSSAATVHRLWTLGLAGCLVIPMVSTLTPTWTLPIVPDSLPVITDKANKNLSLRSNSLDLSYSCHRLR